MKNILIFILLLVLGLFACKKESMPVYKMNAVINGKQFNGSYCYAVMYAGRLTVNGGTFIDSIPQIPYMGFVINSFYGVGAYPIQWPLYATFADIDSGIYPITSASSGSIIITSISPTVTGTFNFTFPDGTAVTEGAFTGQLSN